MPTKKPKQIDWDEFNGMLDNIYRNYAAMLADGSFPITIEREGRSWTAAITIDRKPQRGQEA